MLRKLVIAVAALVVAVGLVAGLALAALWLAFRSHPHETLNTLVPAVAPLAAGFVEPPPIEAPYYDYEVEGRTVRARVVASLRMPWGLAFLPDGRLLVTEKIGALALFDPATDSLTAIAGVPGDVYFTGQGGLMDVAVPPDFAQTRHVFLSYTTRLDDGGFAARVVRLRLVGDRLVEPFEVMVSKPASEHALNFGSRLEFDREGWLYVTVSDHKQRAAVQDPASHLGKTLRYAEDGRVPPEAERASFSGGAALPELWTLGHRNAHGLFADPATGELWSSEHGEQGGDEINILHGGRNYGWPIVSHSEEYGGGKIGDGSERAGIEAPARTFTPAIAPTQLAFYRGDAFPEWEDQLFVATLGRGLIRFEVESSAPSPGAEPVRRLTSEDRSLLREPRLRIRDIAIDSQGRIYAAAERGWLLRLEPSP